MRNASDVIVLGLGGMGTASMVGQGAGRRAARAGVEQFAVGHDRGSSHGSTRVIRKASTSTPITYRCCTGPMSAGSTSNSVRASTC